MPKVNKTALISPYGSPTGSDELRNAASDKPKRRLSFSASVEYKKQESDMNDDEPSQYSMQMEDESGSSEKQNADSYADIIETKRPSGSQYSMGSSANSKYPNAREISETLGTKLKEMALTIFALLFNAACLGFFIILGSTGVLFPMTLSSVDHVLAVIFELVLLVANVFTIIAMDHASAAYFGALLTRKNGYSLAVCGFQQASPFSKISYCSELSLNSPSRKFLSKLAIVWLFAELLKVLTPVPATAVLGSSFNEDSGIVNCILYGNNGVPFDRKWPTITVESGIAELIFGTAIGYLRSERSDINITTAIMTPQIVGAVQDGDTIIGPGFTTDVLTKCSCSAGISIQDITALISDSKEASAATLLSSYRNLDRFGGMASYIDTTTYASQNTTIINSMISGSSICGGLNNTFVTMCQTTLSNPQNAKVLVSYMTDGTPASIAVRWAEVRELTGTGKMAWVNAAITNIHEGIHSSVRLPGNIPGVLTPLLWWTTPNLLATDASLLEGGIETYFTILLRAGMQRTYSVAGSTCIVNTVVKGVSVVKMKPYGVLVCILILSIQLVICIICIAAFFPFLLSDKPVGPGIRMMKDNIYFLVLVNNSSVFQIFGGLCNAPAYTIWQAMDVVCRLGESLSQEADENVGHISLDKPKMIRDLKNGKKYF